MIPLFEHYPLLREKLPYISLGEFPTPIEKLDKLGSDIDVNHLYIKRDDLSGKVYGGNKVRKLEFLLGRALRDKVKEVMTFGCAGSNHATATAFYARHVGLRSISILLPQPNAHYVRKNLLMSHYSGAELHKYRSKRCLGTGTRYQLLRHKLRYGLFPQVIPTGGSSPLGIIGLVNAALELKTQVMKGRIPEPDVIYVACGSVGTTVGLTLGVKAARLKTRITPVRVASEKSSNRNKFINLFQKTNSLLRSADPSFPELRLSDEDLNIRSDFAGEKYALFTEEGMQAIERMERTEGIKLDGTYTGKALAALIDDAGKGKLKDKVVLFWNTLNSRDFSGTIKDIDYRDLPHAFHRYFEQEVQPLDKLSS